MKVLRKERLNDLKKPLIRCPWANNPLFHHYHDTEWGIPVHQDQKHFEFLILEGAQAGLSWSTILKKRTGYKKAFANFNPYKVAQFTPQDAQNIHQNPAVVRNRLKIAAAITNAQAFLKIQKEFGSFDKYIWQFVEGKTIKNKWHQENQIPTTSVEAGNLSKDLKKRGFKFVGPTIVYAHLQAVGLVNDHLITCFRYHQV